MGCVESNVSGIPAEEVNTPPRQPQPDGASFHEKYELGDKIGEGSFGEVRAATLRSTGVEVAVKVLEAGRGSTQSNQNQNNLLSPRGTTPATPRGSTPSAGGTRRPPSPRGPPITPRGRTSIGGQDPLQKFQKSAQNEVSMLQAVARHRQCIQLQDFFNDGHTCFLVFEFCKQGSLLEYLDAKPLATVPELQGLLKEMALGVVHVHEVGIVHRDIKPDNFLVGGDDGKTIKLADFGTATWMHKDGLRTTAGTAPYMSPEMLNDEGYDTKTDVWSFGASCYLILYGDIPYLPREQPLTSAKIKAAIMFASVEPTYEQASGKRLAVPKGAEELVSICLERSPHYRPSSKKLLQHAFLRDVEVPEGLVLSGRGESKPDDAEARGALVQASWPTSEGSTGIPASQAKSEQPS